MKTSGILQVVGVPIGNLGDVSARAMEALRGAEVVACEDTRQCGKLLQLLGIKAPKLVSCFKDNERARVAGLVKDLQAGKKMVLVSDSGMPAVSDPGAVLVAAARAAGVRVEVIPGPSAVLCAVAGSGFEGGFCFTGFLPRKKGELQRRLEELREVREMLVAFESPNRVAATVAAMVEVLGNRRAYLVRELTKMYEEWVGVDLVGILEQVDGKEVRGECVLVVEGFRGEAVREKVTDKEIVARLKAGEGVKAVAAWVSGVEGVGQGVAYKRVQLLKASN